MKRLLAALLTFFALLALTGCGGSPSDGPHLLLYYPAPSGGSPGGDAIVSRSVDWAANSALPTEQQVRRVVSLLLEDSADGSLESPIPASTRLLACQVSAGAAWVDFSSAYGQLSGMELTIADYCVTLSLSQIVGIYSVRITVNGTTEFKAQAIRAAVDGRLTITFADPALEKRRQALLQDNFSATRKLGVLGVGKAPPPAARAGRLRSLAQAEALQIEGAAAAVAPTPASSELARRKAKLQAELSAKKERTNQRKGRGR